MTILVTGAAGFLGRHIVAQALRRGHSVKAMVRSGSTLDLPDELGEPEIVRCDLRARAGIEASLDGVEAVIHAAAVKEGDIYAQLAGTVLTTENLLDAMLATCVNRLLLVSSFSIYDLMAIRCHATLDESAPLERSPETRGDPYAWSKQEQEELVRRYSKEGDLRVTYLRPGVIYGPGSLFTDQLGLRLGERLWFRFAGLGKLRLTYVENCAAAIVHCLECPDSIGRVFNLVDSDLPSRRAYARALARRVSPRPRFVPVPGVAARALARFAYWTNLALFRGRARLPWVLVPAKLGSQARPFSYSNDAIRSLGWTPGVSWTDALDRSLSKGE